jgi:hypothetical protein
MESQILVASRAYGSGGGWPTASLPAKTARCVGGWSTPGPQFTHVGLSAWEPDRSCPLISLVLERPEAVRCIPLGHESSPRNSQVEYVTCRLVLAVAW